MLCHWIHHISIKTNIIIIYNCCFSSLTFKNSAFVNSKCASQTNELQLKLTRAKKDIRTIMWLLKSSAFIKICLLIGIHFLNHGCWAYDPTDQKLASVLLKDDMFEAFYPRQTHGIPNGPARAAHAHGSYFAHRHPALIDTRNSAAYGFRFDGARRFNFDWNIFFSCILFKDFCFSGIKSE